MRRGDFHFAPAGRGSHARRAAEVADIFRRWRDGKFRDDSGLLSGEIISHPRRLGVCCRAELFHTLSAWEFVVGRNCFTPSPLGSDGNENFGMTTRGGILVV